eukprot:TRINITY_DN9325_c0_g1_i1.p2 TRINITY_DN9325_c0_g1~~TRINITY_DN9325_c0_g1_i1.p2  ORF type:complete len:433 (-),score=83.48 TRINITY_DN9325_c0_g1_i1:28-1326(-)
MALETRQTPATKAPQLRRHGQGVAAGSRSAAPRLAPQGVAAFVMDALLVAQASVRRIYFQQPHLVHAGGVVALLLLVFASFPEPSQRDIWPIGEPALCRPNFAPIIVLLPSHAGGKDWYTAKWAGWGQDGDIVTVPGAMGMRAHKPACPVSCRVSHQIELLPNAHAVVIETVAHMRTHGPLGRVLPFPYPPKREGQLRGAFWFESTKDPNYLKHTSAEYLQDYDFTISPKRDSDVPVSAACLWGKELSDYLAPPPASKPLLVATFSTDVDPAASLYISHFMALLQVDSYRSLLHTVDLPSAAAWNNISYRIETMAQYRFVLVTENSQDDDWVSQEFFQALLAGSVPIYLGAANIDEYAPGPHSFISARDFPSAWRLAEYVWQLEKDEVAYNEYFAWKSAGLSPSFQSLLDTCLHTAECRLCQYVTEHQTCTP